LFCPSRKVTPCFFLESFESPMSVPPSLLTMHEIPKCPLP
jgi:hypothetical protein